MIEAKQGKWACFIVTWPSIETKNFLVLLLLTKDHIPYFLLILNPLNSKASLHFYISEIIFRLLTVIIMVIGRQLLVSSSLTQRLNISAFEVYDDKDWIGLVNMFVTDPNGCLP